MGRFIFFVLSLVVLVGCSFIQNRVERSGYINEKIGNDKKIIAITEFAVSDDGRYLAVETDIVDSNRLKIIDLETGKLSYLELWKKENINNKDEDKFIFFNDGTWNVSMQEDKKNGFFDSFSFSIGYHPKSNFGKVRDSRSLLYDISIKPNYPKSFLFSKNKKLIFINIEEEIKALDLEIDDDFEKFMSDISEEEYQKILLEDQNKILKGLINEDGSLSIYNTITNKKLLTVKLFKNQDLDKSVAILGKKYEKSKEYSWFARTPKGYYIGSWDAFLYFGVYKYYEKFYRPDIVRMALQGKSIEENLPTIADIKAPPKIEIIDTKQNQENLKLVVKITPKSGGVGDIRLYHNGTAIALQTKDFTTQHLVKPFTKTYNIKLVDGNNEIKVIAFEQSNSQRSEYATTNVAFHQPKVVKPNIYALVIGVEEFRNKGLNTLKYSYKDAKEFAKLLQAQEGKLYNSVYVTPLVTKDETTKEHILEELKRFHNIDKNDMFVFYVSSHGTVQNGEYLLVTSNVGSLNSLKHDALSGEEIKKEVSNIPALKKLMVFDTCYAGAFEQSLKTKGGGALAEKWAIDRLNHAIGSAIFSASTSSQEAIANGYNGQSIFTYILIDGLKGKADGGRKDGLIYTSELSSYLDEELPLVSKREFKYEQFPATNINGQSFSVSRVR